MLHGLPGNSRKADDVRAVCGICSQADPGPIIGEASLACGIADGSVVILRVVQTLNFETLSSGFIPNHIVQASIEILDPRPAEGDGGALNCMKWIELSADRVGDTGCRSPHALTPSRMC